MKTLLMTLLLVVSCGTGDEVHDAARPSSPPDGPAAPLTQQERQDVCLRSGAILCSRLDACSVTPYAACYADYTAGCPKVVAIRDYDALVNVCFPWMESHGCETFQPAGFVFDPSCTQQLLTTGP